MPKEFQEDFKEEVNKIVSQIVDRAEEAVNEREAKRHSQEGVFVDLLERRELEEKTKKVLVVVTTPKSVIEYKASEEYEALERIIFDNTYSINGETHFGVEVEIVSDNTIGLPVVYNRFITAKYLDYDYVCYIHDDLVIYDNKFYDKLVSAHKEYEIVGLAGATKINLPVKIDKSTAWHKMSVEVVEGRPVRHQSGFVAHTKEGQTWSTHFGVVPQQVKVIDGLFMSFDIKACLEKSFTFDTDFKFHHYDISASFRAIQCGMKQTTTDIFVVHKGMGEMDHTWVDSHKVFVNKYKHFQG